MVGLILCGFASGLLAAFIASRLMEDGHGGWGDIVGAVLGMVTGYPLGVIIGMIITRFVVRYPGSLLLGIPGSLIALVIVFILADLISNPDVIFGSIFIASPLGGTATYHIRR